MALPKGRYGGLKPRKKPKRKAATISYAKLSDNYKTFVPITDSVFKKLPKKERYYIKEQARRYKEDIRDLTAEDFSNMPKSIQTSVMERMEGITTGKVLHELNEINYDNYISGLYLHNRDDIVILFEKLHDTLTADEFDRFMSTDAPDLYLFYEDKNRANSKRDSNYSPQVSGDAMEELKNAIINKLEDKGIDPYDDSGED